MKIQLLLLCLSCVGSFSIAQNHAYQVKLDEHRIGSFHQSIEFDQNTHTFSSLNLQIKTVQGAIKFSQEVHFVESDSGELNSVRWFNVLADTLRYQILIKEDSIIRINGISRSAAQISHPPMIGPEKIRRMSSQILDTVGSAFEYWTFVAEFNKPMQVRRELVAFTIKDAQKLRLVRESLDSTNSTIGFYDSEFNLIFKELNSAFGKISLSKVQRPKNSQFFESNHFNKNNLKSNIRFSDPLQINSVKVKIHVIDNQNPLSLDQENQEIILLDSGYQTVNVTDVSPSISLPESLYLTPQEHFWTQAKAVALADSLLQGTQSQELALSILIGYCKTKDKYAALALNQLTIAAGIPSRLVYGYAYDQWFWHPRYWVEIAKKRKWTTVDMSSIIQSNSALKIALYKYRPGRALNHIYLADLPKLTAIQVESFGLMGQTHSVSNQVLPYYLEKPVYENEGLGIRFNIPDGFELVQDGTKKPTIHFLSLKNIHDEKIIFSQILVESVDKAEIEAKKRIAKHVNDSDTELVYEKKLNLWHGYSGHFGAIAILQGSSLIFISIDHQNPDFIINALTRKNIHLKY
ncbi:MAG: transglutaminase domain-containing protein [Reichenbachiella sp.]|uniref:transglutaminase domain-containing protein n=1 Tax=Reichenbachiella sp. TaxID=2184521 RepID=UPI0032667523